MNKVSAKNLSNFSVYEGKEIESLIFFYYCSQVNNEDEEVEKNQGCFERFEDALDYFNSLESQDGWCKKMDEFFIDENENTMGLYSNICLEEKEAGYWDKLVNKYSFNN